MEIHKKGSGYVVSAVSVHRDRYIVYIYIITNSWENKNKNPFREFPCNLIDKTYKHKLQKKKLNGNIFTNITIILF